MTTRSKLFGGVTFFLGILVALTPRFILPVCEYYGKAKMACSYTGRSEMVLGWLIVAISVAAILSRSAESLKWLMFSAFSVGVAELVLPSFLGYCHSPQMPCNYGTVPMLRLLGGLLLVSTAVGFFVARKAEVSD